MCDRTLSIFGHVTKMQHNKYLHEADIFVLMMHFQEEENKINAVLINNIDCEKISLFKYK